MLKKIKIKKILFIILILIVFGENLFPIITKRKADKVLLILNSLKSKKPLPGKIVITDSQINSYFHFYRGKIFTKEVEIVRVYFENGFIRLRLIYKSSDNKKGMLFRMFQNSVIEIKGNFTIINLKNRCIRIEFKDLYINNVLINKKLFYNIVKYFGEEYALYFESYCIKDYRIKKIKVKKRRLIITTD